MLKDELTCVSLPCDVSKSCFYQVCVCVWGGMRIFSPRVSRFREMRVKKKTEVMQTLTIMGELIRKKKGHEADRGQDKRRCTADR